MTDNNKHEKDNKGNKLAKKLAETLKILRISTNKLYKNSENHNLKYLEALWNTAIPSDSSGSVLPERCALSLAS